MADGYIKKSTALAIIGKHWRSKMYADDAIQAALDEIGCHVPAADVAPVRHGRWLAHRLDNSYTTWTCSVCGTIGVEAFHYCPNCGCKMDGGET